MAKAKTRQDSSDTSNKEESVFRLEASVDNSIRAALPSHPGSHMEAKLLWKVPGGCVYYRVNYWKKSGALRDGGMVASYFIRIERDKSNLVVVDMT